MAWLSAALSLSRLRSPALVHAPLRAASAYESRYSLENLYPTGGERTGGSGCAPSAPDREQELEGYSGDIPVDRLDVSYSRSSGPGGQNVNKVNSKASVRFHVASAEWLPQDIRDKMQEKLKHRIVRSGELIVTSETSRYQMRNLADCLRKLRLLIGDSAGALARERRQSRPEEALLRRSRVEAASRERLRQKRLHAAVKRDRWDHN